MTLHDALVLYARAPSEKRATKDRAQRLRQAREAKGYSLRDLAAAAGVSARTISKIEEGDGEAASCITMASIADALGVPRGWLAFGG